MPKRINVYGHIVNDNDMWIYDMFGLNAMSPKKFRNMIEEVKDEELEVYINSNGGSVFSASEMYSDLMEHSKNVVVKIVGMAASAASFLAMAGDEILISPTGMMMIHNSSTYTEGDHQEMSHTSDYLKSVDGGIRNAYKLKANITDEKLTELMNRTTFMNAQEAKEIGLVDGIMFDSEDILSTADIIDSLTVPKGALENIINKWTGSTKGREEEMGKENIVVEKTTESIQTETLNITKEYLAENYSSIYEEIKNEGVVAERKRIQDIDNLGILGMEDVVNKAKYETFDSVETLAVNVLKAQQKTASNRMEGIKADKVDIGIDNTVDMSAKEEDFINSIINSANKEAK